VADSTPRLHLVRDLLDKKVVDRDGRDMGRVDGVILEIGGSRAPNVTAIEIGAAVLAGRVCPLLGRVASAIERVLGIDEGRPIRIPYGAILDIADQIRVDVSAGDTPAVALEHKLRNIFRSLPGGSS
jgi:sporulation protein YlmC with PRC-barrel domain